MTIDIKAVYGDSREIAGGLEVVRDDLESGFEVTRHHYILREAQVHITGMYAAAIELQAENAALRAKVAELEEQLDSLNNSYATCENPNCTPTQVCELFFNGCVS